MDIIQLVDDGPHQEWETSETRFSEWEPSETQWARFFEELLPTREVDSLIDFDRICVVAMHFYKRSGPLFFLYYTDLSVASKDNDNTIQSLKPILQFRGRYGDLAYSNYVVVGSKLLLVGGLTSDRGWSSTLSYYDFGSCMYSDTTTNIEEKDLIIEPQMWGRKYQPIVAVVGGSKICVFSTVLWEFYHSKTVHPPNFEVYDTESRRWTMLRELGNYGKCESHSNVIRVWSYCVERSCIVICTDIGTYGINIGDTDGDPRWVKIEGSERMNWDPFIGRWTAVGNNFCSPFDVAGWGESQLRRPLAFKNKGPFFPLDRVGALCSERVGNDVVLCSVRGTLIPENVYAIVPVPIYVPVLMVNVVRFDGKSLDNLRGDVWQTIQSDKSFNFVIESQTCLGLDLLGCFFPFKVTNKIEDGKDSLENERRSKRPKLSPSHEQTG